MSLVPLLLAAASTDNAWRFQIAPAASFRQCSSNFPGETLRYRFRASAVVDFNIHYHRGKEIFYPVQHAAIDRLEAEFRAPAADDYCLMWENKSQAAVDVEGAIVR